MDSVTVVPGVLRVGGVWWVGGARCVTCWWCLV